MCLIINFLCYENKKNLSTFMKAFSTFIVMNHLRAINLTVVFKGNFLWLNQKVMKNFTKLLPKKVFIISSLLYSLWLVTCLMTCLVIKMSVFKFHYKVKTSQFVHHIISMLLVSTAFIPIFSASCLLTRISIAIFNGKHIEYYANLVMNVDWW